MSDHQTYSDEELTAYLDGESDTVVLADIEHALKQDSTLRARLEGLSLDKQKLKQAFELLLDAAPDAPDLEPAGELPVDRTVFGFLHLVAAAAVALMIGVGAGLLMTGDRAGDWRDNVAAYQALYANGTLAHIKQPEEAASAELARVSSAIGKDLDLSVINAPDQLDYKRAQILHFQGKPLIQLAFLSKVGEPVALCVIQLDDTANSKPVFQEMQGMQAASWAKDGYAYLLIGGDDPELIESAAEEYSKRI
ncbi:MAG: hypothetical protein ABJN26_08395 [Stappiaceae bacterium]